MPPKQRKTLNPPAKLKVLLLGSTGRVGKSVLSNLIEKQINVVCLVRNPSSFPVEFKDNPLVEIFACPDVTDFCVISPSVKNCGTIIQCLGHQLTFFGIIYIN
jgi:putative NADH-flavin reductase